VTPDVISAIIGVVTFFLTCLGNAIILGIFLGGMRAEMRVNSDRLAKIEGMFTLVPRQIDQKNVGESLSSGLVDLGAVVPIVGIPTHLRAQNPIHAQ
jgi:hypothetical protein